MKKVRIMLTAIAVLGIVGGALAYKAKAFSTFVVYQSVEGTCPSIEQVFDANGPILIQNATSLAFSPDLPTTVDVVSCTADIRVKPE
jgi:hypothetical protein